MNGSAINQVLLNLPQSGSGSNRSSSTKDTDTADFAQALQAQQTSARTERNEAVAHARQDAQRNRAAQQKREITEDVATRRNNRHVDDRQALAKSATPKASPDNVPTDKAASKLTAKRKESEATESTCTPDQPASTAGKDQQTTAVTETAQQGDLNDEATADSGQEQSGEVSSELQDIELTAATDDTPILSNTHLQASADTIGAQTTDGAPVTDLTQLTDQKNVLAEQLVSDPTTTATKGEKASEGADPIEDIEGLDTSDDTDTSKIAVGNDQALAQNLLTPLTQNQAGAQVVATPLTTQPNSGTTDTASTDDGGNARTNGTAVTLATEGEPVAQTADNLVDDLVAQTATAPKEKTIAQLAANNAVTDEQTLPASDRNTGAFDKTSFEKMFKTMAQSALGDGSSRDHQSAPSAQGSPAASVLEYVGRQEAPGAAGLRNFVVQTSVQTPVGQPQWSQAVGEKVLWLAAQNISSAEINLHPQDLGPIQVKVSVNQDQQANVTFTSHHPVVREVLDQNLNRLRDMFSEQGLNLINVDVSDRSFQRQQGEGKEQPGQGAGSAPEAEEETLVAVSTIKSQRLVDHYA